MKSWRSPIKNSLKNICCSDGRYRCGVFTAELVCTRGNTLRVWLRLFLRSAVPALLAVLLSGSSLLTYAEEESMTGQTQDIAECETYADTVDGNSDTVVVCVLDSGYGTADTDNSGNSDDRNAGGDMGDTADGRIIRGWNYLDDSDDITDEQGHGTDICTLIAENAPDAEIVMLKCFDEALSPDGEAIVAALYAAVDDYHADVINMSWIVCEEDEELLAAVQYAAGSGAVLVASAGNLSLTSGPGSEVYPALWEEVIGVGGVDPDEEGNPVSSLWYLASEAVYVCTNGEFGDEKGSSYAAARISGVVAAYLAEHPAADADEDADVDGNIDADEDLDADEDIGADGDINTDADVVRRMLLDQAVDLGESGYDTTYGWGYVETDD
ncbi:MAG: S8/S53 family peptidase [Lachnospiraceae bacterium]|nr:S8/S53 family peptidase [Lachnospiraceae bacterium]